jgi:2-oxoglutarate/2-oxoacid ferredoxin oxidoreductase subunit alpha
VKWNTAKDMVPAPHFYREKVKNEHALLFFGTSQYAVEEAMDLLKEEKIRMDAVRIRAFPFNAELEEFIRSHQKIFVVEQNRDAQMRSLMMIEMGVDPAKLIPVLNYDGMPLTADHVVKEIRNHVTEISEKI